LEVVIPSVVACVTWVRGGCNRFRREKILSVGVIASSVAAYITCVVVTAAVMAER
jgi:hypothetical protein